MTDVFTCSYRLYQLDMGQPVICSLTRPRDELWQHAPSCWELTPRWTYFRADDAGAKFEEQLARYGPQMIARALQAIAVEYQASSLVLLCWETDWDSCHRQRAARFLLETTGWVIRELGQRVQPEGALF
jgi:Protein of unknown function, DUF488